MTVKTRFAPSPTGDLHMGNYRTALFSWLFARSQGGQFIVRIEDTDKERSKKEFEDNIFESLEWLSLDHDELYRQSENIESHKKHLQELIDKDLAYISKEEEGERDEVIRFRNPNKTVRFTDLIRGDIEFDTTDLGEFVIAKSIDEPVFHLAVVVDDFEEGVTHVVRGEDHISNTPRHILIQEAIGAPTPIYAHLPLVLNESREKLSKRNGAQPLLSYREEGFLPEAVINYMALLGWNPGTEQEIFTPQELLEVFDLAKIHKGAATFDPIKLRWVNREHLKQKESHDAEIFAALKETKYADTIDEEASKKFTPLFLERIETYGDVKRLTEEGEIDFAFTAPELSGQDVVLPKIVDEKDSLEKTKKHLEFIIITLEQLSDFDAETIKNALWDYATEQGRGEVLWPMRFTLTGKKQSPDPFTVASILEKEETLSRLKTIVEKL